MGLFSLITKPLRILDGVADVAEDAIDETLEQVADYLSGDWGGTERAERRERYGR